MDRELYLPDEHRRHGNAGKRGRLKNRICIVVTFLMAVLLTGSIVRGQQVEAKVEKTQQELAKEVFRFHVLANSDSEEDQALKMEVKESVLDYMKEQIPESDSAEETKEWARGHLEQIEGIAEKIVKENGYTYQVNAEVTFCDFPDKTYGDVTFPAGRYEALRIEIGRAEGHNWWCVLYPNLCFLDSVHAVVPEEGKEELREVLTDEEYEMVTATTHFKVKWFFFE